MRTKTRRLSVFHVFTNIEFQDSRQWHQPATCLGDGWKDDKQKEESIQSFKDALEDEDDDFEPAEWLSEQGFKDIDYLHSRMASQSLNYYELDEKKCPTGKPVRHK